jgi:hypothetical protein
VIIWVNTVTSTTQIAFAEGDGSGWGYFLGLNSPPGEWFVGSPTQAVYCSKSIEDGKWHMLAATYNASSLFPSFYIDGLLCSSNTLASFTPNNLGHSINIGASNAGPIDNWQGSLEYAYIYNKVLGVNYIQAIYNSEKPQ